MKPPLNAGLDMGIPRQLSGHQVQYRSKLFKDHYFHRNSYSMNVQELQIVLLRQRNAEFSQCGGG